MLCASARCCAPCAVRRCGRGHRIPAIAVDAVHCRSICAAFAARAARWSKRTTNGCSGASRSCRTCVACRLHRPPICRRMLPARGPHPRTGRTAAPVPSGVRATAKVGFYPGPFRGKPAAARARFRPLRHATADRWETKGSARAVATARDGSRVLTPHQPSCCGGTSPTPLTAGMGPRDSQTEYALERAAARRVRPPSAS